MASVSGIIARISPICTRDRRLRISTRTGTAPLRIGELTSSCSTLRRANIRRPGRARTGHIYSFARARRGVTGAPGLIVIDPAGPVAPRWGRHLNTNTTPVPPPVSLCARRATPVPASAVASVVPSLTAGAIPFTTWAAIAPMGIQSSSHIRLPSPFRAEPAKPPSMSVSAPGSLARPPLCVRPLEHGPEAFLGVGEVIQEIRK